MGGLPKRFERDESRSLLECPWCDEDVEQALGPSTSTRRDLAFPRSWLGLSEGDRRLLVRYFQLSAVQPDEFHTHVPVGQVPRLRSEHRTERNRRLVGGCYPRRVDAAMRFGRWWHLVEAKVDANHYVIGQVLCYAFWWRKNRADLPLGRVVVLSDVVESDIRAVMVANGIVVVEVGGATGAPGDPVPDPGSSTSMAVGGA